MSNNGSFTLWGLFSEFSQFVHDNWNDIPEQKRKELMDFIELCLVEGDINENLDNAVCTCFLENLSGAPPFSGELRQYMKRKSLRFFNKWDNPRSIYSSSGKHCPVGQ